MSILAILYVVFDPKTGPTIRYQEPENYLKQDVFDINHSCFIPKPQIQKNIIKIILPNYYVMGYPVCLEDTSYDRNIFMFNVCMVISPSDICYEKSLIKLALFYETLEKNYKYLSNASNWPTFFSNLSQIRHDINNKGSTTIFFDDRILSLKTKRDEILPKDTIIDYDIPIFIDQKCYDFMDILVKKLSMYIDGFNDVTRIAKMANVNKRIVKTCLNNLLAQKIIKIIPPFNYSNVYMCTKEILHFCKTGLTSQTIREQCIQYVRLHDLKLPKFSDICMLYSKLNAKTTFEDISTTYKPLQYHIDEKKLIFYGLIHNLIRLRQMYPLMKPNNPNPINMETQKLLRSHPKLRLDGSMDINRMSSITGLNVNELVNLFNQDPQIVVIWK